MAVRAIWVAVVLSAAGCGTVANLAPPGPGRGDKVPFGGVAHDRAVIDRETSGTPDRVAGGGSRVSTDERVLLVALYAADLPISFIGDVLTLPYTCGYPVANAPTDYPPIRLASPTDPPLPVQTGGKPATTPPQPLPLPLPRSLPPTPKADPPVPPLELPPLPPRTPDGQPKQP